MAGQKRLKRLLLIATACIPPIAALALAPQRPGQPEIRISSLEHRIHDLINRERTAAKLKPLQFDERLVRIARSHSEDMARRRFFSHVNPDGQDPTARGERAGYVCKKVAGRYTTEGLAENIFQGNLYSRIRISANQKSYDWNTSEELANQTVRGWMNSPGHRRNILEKNYTHEGIGIGISNDNKVYVTQLFC
jgi:uncharacterized protein YkwD